MKHIQTNKNTLLSKKTISTISSFNKIKSSNNTYKNTTTKHNLTSQSDHSIPSLLLLDPIQRVRNDEDTCISIPCHSRAQTRESREQRNHYFLDIREGHEYDRRIESGRSMVEMLGVLAVVGVLSIGGIMGYSYGMDKYRANETINDVNLRAMDLISQLTQGATPTLASWAEIGTAGYPISLHTDETTANHYIKVEKVPFRVCDIISDTMPESVVIEVNNDTEQCADGENTMYFAYEGFDEGAGDNTGACPTGTSAEGLGGYAGTTDSDGHRCYCASADTKWDTTSSACVAQDGACSSFADCNKGEYCQFNSSACTGDTLEIPTTGVCAEIGAPVGSYGDGNVHFFVSAYGMGGPYNWWSMQDLCASFGGRLPSLEDFGCTDYNMDSCTSDTLSVIQAAMGIPAEFWTTNLYEENNPNSCKAWSFSFEGIRSYNRNAGLGTYACRITNLDWL